MPWEQLSIILDQACRLKRNQPVLIGVSGGADSLSLAHAVWMSGYPIVVAHYNHGLRPEAWQDGEVVEAFCRQFNLPFMPGEGDVRVYADSLSLSIEEAARILRYRFLFEQARQIDAQAVAVGHTADDQVETILMHLLRGSGLAGLRGMFFRTVVADWDQQIPVVRPLLETWRKDTEAYCLEHGLRPVQDATNFDPAYLRNRIRHELIPFLETYNPQVRQALRKTSIILSGDYASLEEAVEAAWEKVVVETGSGGLTLHRQPFLALSTGVKRLLMRRALATFLPGLPDVDFETVERSLSWMDQAGFHRADLVGGVRLEEAGDEVRLVKPGNLAAVTNSPQVAPGQVLELTVPGKVALSDGCWWIEADLVEAVSSLNWHDHSPNLVELDLEKLSLPLQVRGRQVGDRWQPLGMGGKSQKLSDFYINEKLPQIDRDHWPLVITHGQIAWVVGYRPAQPFRITETTRQVLRLRLQPG